MQRAYLAAALLVAVSACNTDPSKGKPQAAVAAASTEAPLQAAGGTQYSFSNDGSTLGFIGAKVTAKHEGSFGAFKGTVQVVDNDPTKSSVRAEIDVASISVEPAKLNNHLKSPDLLDVAQFPKANFASTSIRAGGDNGATHTITGNFTLHGVTKAVTFPAKIQISPDAVDVESEFGINRKDFGVVYPGMPDDLIKDEVLIKLKLHAKKG
ncbi:MAG: YceI family protein [Polyangiaceae bacterium]